MASLQSPGMTQTSRCHRVARPVLAPGAVPQLVAGGGYGGGATSRGSHGHEQDRVDGGDVEPDHWV